VILDGALAGAVAAAPQALRPASWWRLPTETVYGLAADAGNDAAVAAIFAAKGRPSRPSADRACRRGCRAGLVPRLLPARCPPSRGD
jgi:hypothetical protein